MTCVHKLGIYSRYVGNYSKNECKIELRNVTSRDAGMWECKMEMYVYGGYQGLGHSDGRKIEVEVISASWSPWSKWSNCTSLCGTSHRRRRCNRYVPSTDCDGNEEEERRCEDTICQSKYKSDSIPINRG